MTAKYQMREPGHPPLTSAMGGKRTLVRLAMFMVSWPEFLIVYDYGMGGAWGFARAQSEAEILQTFPELKVVHKTPEWLTLELEKKMRSESSFTIADPTSYPKWLQTLIEQRRIS